MGIQNISTKEALKMSIYGSIIVPHPPLILPEIGRGREKTIQSTIDACRAACARVSEWKPDLLIISSPHTVSYANYFHISPGISADGSMEAFGEPQLKFHVEYDTAFREEFIRLAQQAGIPAGTLGERDPKLDHGVCIPLYFLREAGIDCPVVRMGLSGLSPLAHYKLGICAARAAEKLGRRAAFIASGDLSHMLLKSGPYGFAKEGPVFDEQVTSAMAEGDFLKFLTFDPSFCDRAAECGLRSFQIMAGALDGLKVDPELLNYEGPFGVGYAAAVFTVTGRDENRRFGKVYEEMERRRLEKMKASEDPFVKLARLSLETYVRTGKHLKTVPAGLPEEMTARRAGAFVSLHIHGQLRGCIGTIAPTAENLASEIINNAVSAGSLDPRFSPVRENELQLLEYSVDVLSPAEPIDSAAELDVKRYGVIVSCGERRGLLLPDLDGVDTPEQQVDIARRKGGIEPDEPYTLKRFEVVRHR